MNRIAAVVVTYNRIEMLKKCVASLLGQTVACDILLIDNASTDDTEAWSIEQTVKNGNVFYKNTGANIGGAGGFNFGMRWAIEAGYDYVWIMDDDAIPNKDCLESLVDAQSEVEDDFGFLSSNVLWRDGSVCLMNRQKYYNKMVYPQDYRQNLIPVTQATFVSLYISAKTVRKIGLPIKDFFIWGDDVEYTRRMSIVFKLPCYMVKNSEVKHLMAVNRGSNIAIDVSERIERYYYAYRNEFYTYRRDGIKGMGYYFLKCLYNFLRILTKPNTQKIKRIKILMKAIVAGYRFDPKIEYVK